MFIRPSISAMRELGRPTTCGAQKAELSARLDHEIRRQAQLLHDVLQRKRLIKYASSSGAQAYRALGGRVRGRRRVHFGIGRRHLCAGMGAGKQ